MGYKTDQAIRNMQENEATALLKRHQGSIMIMDHQDYENEKKLTDHNKLSKELILHKFYSKLLEATWTKSSSYYEEYEKAEQLMKMHALDRNALVQESYKKSFEVKSDLEAKIEKK
jgi:RNAse (barnase) inhibitor barstar